MRSRATTDRRLAWHRTPKRRHPSCSTSRIQMSVALALSGVLASSPELLWANELGTIDEVVVTARKRDEALRDVPITITAFSQNDIAQMGLDSLEDISAVSPGLSFAKQGDQRGGRSESVVRFRGMSINDISPVRQLASVFQDGIYVSGGLAAISMEDVARVEVIKGPQNAHFGRSTFGGAVNFITRDPSLEYFGGEVNLSAAQDGEYDVSGSLDIPLVAGKWAMKVGARYYSADGRYTSTADGGALGQEETRSVNLTVVGSPTDNLNLRLRAFYSEDDDGLPPTFALTTNLHNCGPFFSGGKTYFCGELPQRSSPGLNTRLEGRARDIFVNNTVNSQAIARAPLPLDSMGMNREIARVNLSGDWSIGDSPYTLSFNAGYNSNAQVRMTDVDHTGRPVWVEANWQDIEDRSFEVRLARDTGPLNWMLGVSHFDLEYIAPTGATIGWLYPSVAVPNGVFADQTVSASSVTTSGVFGSVSYQLTDTVSLSLEGRWQADKIEEAGPSIALSETFENFLPRAIAQWTPTRETNLYAIYAKGNMPGNFNGNVAQLNATQRDQVLSQTGATEFVDEAELENFEIGWKQSFMDDRAFISAAAYYMEWQNQQNRTLAVIDDAASPSGSRTVPVTAGSGFSVLRGLELEGQFKLSSNLTFRGSFNWADSEIRRFNCDICVRVLGTADVSGNSLPRFPEYSGSLGATYARDLSNGWNWFTRADTVYTGRAWDEVLNLSYAPDYWVVNLRSGVEVNQWRVEAFVTNLLDDKHYRSAARAGDFTLGSFDISSFVVNVTPAEPRQFGIRARWSF